MAFESYRKITGVIRAIVTGDSCCHQMISIMTDNGIVNFNVSMNTIIVDNIRLRRGMRVAAYYDANLPVPAIFPPQYQAQLVTALRQNQEVMLNYFDENLLAGDDSLQLNIGPSTRISTINGQQFACNPGNMELLVYYTVTTMSLPPQTTPQRVIVMCPE
ncbi:hypothetical protein [Mediterraneibacter agrestimuris]|uniref:hypothetical protein n=1 Tax=Mediterraneibacter agrestimuris TaxID=2941333 RepID=UPI00203B1190|nr:hypothetical protein [Mediterraneibacter agrestimuris]